VASLEPVKVDVISDIVCPWCYIGKLRLDKALARLPDVPLRVRYRPYFLEPSLPHEGIPQEQFIERHFTSMDTYRARTLQLIAIAKAEGVTYRPDLIKRQPNTLDCHRLVYWARTTPIGDMSPAMMQRLMESFHRDGDDLSDINVLAQAAAECGLDRVGIRQKLRTQDDVETVVIEARAASSQGISGVPTYVFADRYEVSGLQSVEQLINEIRCASAKLGHSG
jgi:predicted DsbA family dithiol-disulfide isomerase